MKKYYFTVIASSLFLAHASAEPEATVTANFSFPQSGNVTLQLVKDPSEKIKDPSEKIILKGPPVPIPPPMDPKEIEKWVEKLTVKKGIPPGHYSLVANMGVSGMCLQVSNFKFEAGKSYTVQLPFQGNCSLEENP